MPILLSWVVRPDLVNLVRLRTYRRQFKIELRNRMAKHHPSTRTSKGVVPEGAIVGPLLLVTDVNSASLRMRELKICRAMFSDDIVGAIKRTRMRQMDHILRECSLRSTHFMIGDATTGN